MKHLFYQFKKQISTRFNIKFLFFPNSLVFCLFGILFCFLGAWGSGFLVMESQKAICPFKEAHYNNLVFLYLLAGLKRKILTVPKQSSVLN